MANKDYLIESDRNIFLTGKAGTGKTYRIRELIAQMEKQGKTVLVCAPTGTAAVNAGGETAHSLFGIPVPCYGVSISKTPGAKIKTLAMADVVIIDEVSMMRNDTFSYAMRVLKKAEKVKGSRIRVILTGDFSQLPPVVTKKDVTYLKKFGYDTSGYAFTTKEWAALHLKVVELTKIWRQKEDNTLAEQLGKVRKNDPSCLIYFRKFVKPDYIPKEEDIQICGTNAEADEINRKYLESLDGDLMVYQSEKHGRNILGICDDIVLLKKGAKVMFLVNDVIKNQYYNGSFGIVTALNSKCVTVRLDNGKEIPVFPYEYKSYSYKVVGGNLTKNEMGSVKQIPLKVAKAITIHKSQGKTFDHAVITPSIFAPGQLYVALSRVTSEKGLVLTQEIKLNNLKGNDIVNKFIEDGYTYEIKTEKKPATKKTTSKKTTTKTTSKSKKKPAKPKKKTTKARTNQKSPTKKITRKTVEKKTTEKRTAGKGKTSKTYTRKKRTAQKK